MIEIIRKINTILEKHIPKGKYHIKYDNDSLIEMKFDFPNGKFCTRQICLDCFNFNRIDIFEYKILKMWNENNIKPKLETYTYGFNCPDISKIKTKEQKEEVYNILIEEFQYKLNDWLYK